VICCVTVPDKETKTILTDEIAVLQVETVEFFICRLGLVNDASEGTQVVEKWWRVLLTSITSSYTTKAVPRVFGPFPNRTWRILPYRPNTS
jgi:hypothetical protein